MGSVKKLLVVGFGLWAAACARPAVVGTSPAWRTLTLADFKGYQSPTVPAGWMTDSAGVIYKDRGGVTDLMTKDQFGDFELSLDWRIAERGNSGIFYRGTEEYDHI